MLNHALNTTHQERLSQIAKAMGHPKRIAILDALMQGVQCNCEISAQLGLADNLISHHMRILEECGLVQSERDPNDARWIYYQVAPAFLAETRDLLCSFFDPARIQPRQPLCGPSSGRGCNPADGPLCP